MDQKWIKNGRRPPSPCVAGFQFNSTASSLAALSAYVHVNGMHTKLSADSPYPVMSLMNLTVMSTIAMAVTTLRQKKMMVDITSAHMA